MSLYRARFKDVYIYLINTNIIIAGKREKAQLVTYLTLGKLLTIVIC